MATNNSAIKTTGDLREVIAMAILGVKNGDLSVDKASQMHKLAGQLNDSLYSEVKMAAFIARAGGAAPKLGELPIGSDTGNALQITEKK